MKTNIKATGIELTGAIKTYLDERLSYLEKFMGERATNASAQVEIGKETKHHKHGELFRAEINLSVGHHHLRAVATESDLYAAIDKIKDEMAREIKNKQHKEKALVKKGGRAMKQALQDN